MNLDIKKIISYINPVEVVGKIYNLKIKDISNDSRNITKDSLFIAIKGINNDGHNFIDSAIKNGAIVILCTHLPKQIHKNIVYLKTNSVKQILPKLVDFVFDKPSTKIKLIGITGTNGKTTTAHNIYNTLKFLGIKSGLISTVQTIIGKKIVQSLLTTPDIVSLNKILYKMVNENCKYCVMEVSSHSIDQKRIENLFFDVAIFTNISHDHLDYHKDFKSYIYTKKKFFDNLSSLSISLINSDDSRSNVMVQNTKSKVIKYGAINNSDYRFKVLSHTLEGTEIEIEGVKIWTLQPCIFNQYNIIATYAVFIELGFEKYKILTILSQLKLPKGRLNLHKKNDRYYIIDYAHTPDALENLLKNIKNINNNKGKIISIFGCGGDRDITKRKLMGKISSIYSDITILTNDNPRSENPKKIISDIKKGIVKDANVVEIIDRFEAIKTAFLLSKPHDIILIAGKGHENTQEIGVKKIQYSDIETLNKIIN